MDMRKKVAEYDKTMNGMKDRLAKLKKAAEKDAGPLAKLEEEYEQAVLINDPKAPKLFAKLSALRSKVNERNEEIAVYERNMEPVRLRERQKLADAFQEGVKEHHALLGSLRAEQEKAKQEYIKKVAQMYKQAKDFESNLMSAQIYFTSAYDDPKIRELANYGKDFVIGSYHGAFAQGSQIFEGEIRSAGEKL